MTTTINYMLFSDLWDAALKTESRDAFIDHWGTDLRVAALDALRITYDMAHGGIKAIRSAIELSQRDFADQYELPRRTVEDWETGSRTPPPYVVKHLGYAVLTDTLMLRSEFGTVEDSRKIVAR